MIPTVSKELRDLIERYEKQHPGELQDMNLRQLIFVVVKLTRNLDTHKTYDGTDKSAVDIVRRALFSKLNLANLYKVKDTGEDSS